jgi:hypothetical protein
MSVERKILGYKIRNTKTGLYLRSGADISESRVGKIWARKGAAINAINMKISSLKENYLSASYINEYKNNTLNYEIVELIEGDSHPIQFYLGDIKF